MSEEPPLQSLYLRGKRLAYTAQGDGSVIVALHGYPGSSHDFRQLTPHLTGSFRVLCLDMPGYGASEATEGVASYDRDAHTLIEALEALRIERPVLLTHSMGAAVAASALCEVPSLARAVAFLAPPGLTPHRVYRRTPCKTLSKIFAPAWSRRWLAPAARFLGQRAGFPASLPVTALYRATDMAARFEPPQHARRMRAVRVPAMLAYACNDPLVELEIFRALSPVLPEGPRLEFGDGGHYVQHRHAADIAAALAQWLLPDQRQASAS